MPNLDLMVRRTNLDTDAEGVCAAWWNLLPVGKSFLPWWWQQSMFPGRRPRLDGDDVLKNLI